MAKLKTEVLIVGGPDVDARIPFMQRLDDFQISAIGSSNELKDKFTQAGFDYYSYSLNRGTNPIADISTFFSLYLLFRSFNPDIVHTFDTKPGVWGRIAAKLAGVPIIIGTLPGLGSLYTNDTLSTRLTRSIYQTLQKLACVQSDVTTFQHQDDLQHFVSAGVVPQSKALVIPGSGVATEVYDQNYVLQSDRAHVRSELGISQDALVVTMISRLIRSKGVLEFGIAAQIVKEQHPEINFLLVGPTDVDSGDSLNSDELNSLRKTLLLSGPRKDIPTILAISNIFVLPTYYREGIPRVLLEAASMGLPIVTTNTPGCNEVVEDGVNGFLVPVRDSENLSIAILRLISDAELRKRFGHESRQQALYRFDIAKIAEQTSSIYTRLLRQKGLLPNGDLS